MILLKGKVSLGEREFETEFLGVKDAIKSDYMLWRDCGQSYRISYRGIELELDEDLSFMEMEEALYTKIKVIDRALDEVK